MSKDHLLKFLGRLLVLRGHILSGKHLHRRKSLTLRSIRYKEHDERRTDQTRHCSHYEAGLPAKPSHNKGKHIVRNELTDIWAGTEKTIVRTAL